MANTFKKFTVTNALTGGSLVYTVPASTTAVVIGFIISNKITTAEIKIEATTSGVQIVGTNTVIPIGAALSVLDGKIVLNATDTVIVTPDTPNACDIILSVMEIT